MVSVCTVPARGVRSGERFGGYKTINRILTNALGQERAMIKRTCAETSLSSLFLLTSTKRSKPTETVCCGENP